MDFHKFYFDWGAATSDPAKPPAVPGRNTICSPKARELAPQANQDYQDPKTQFDACLCLHLCCCLNLYC